ncbi:MAG: arsenate reductase [Alphaproteobacteria bacterium]|nr:MAG: arsenate reductase [Alphaproteobacteria bacterium]
MSIQETQEEKETMFTLYGLGHCSTVQKALAFIAFHKAPVTLIDYAQTPLLIEWLERWKEAFGDWPVNTASFTYRPLKNTFPSLSDAEKCRIIIEKPALVKRPVLEKDGAPVCFGFSAKKYGSLLNDELSQLKKIL